MKTTHDRFLILIAGLLCASIGAAFSQDQEAGKDKKPQRPPVEETKADSPKKPAPEGPSTESRRVVELPKAGKKPDAPKKPAGPPQGKGPEQRFGNLSSEDMLKMRDQMRKTGEEIMELRRAGKHDEAEKKMAEVRKKFEGFREKFGRGGPPSFGQRGPGEGKGGPPWSRGRPESDSPDQKKPAPRKPPGRPSADSEKQAAKPAERKGPPHHPDARRPEHHGDGPDHRKPESRGHGDGPKFAQDRSRHDRSRGFRPPGGPPFMRNLGSFQRGPGGGPPMMNFRMMQMKRMAMMVRAGNGPASFRGPGAWGRQSPFAGRGPAGPQTKLQMFQAKRAAAAKADPGRKSKSEAKRAKAGKSEKSEKKKRKGKRASKTECPECAKAKKES